MNTLKVSDELFERVKNTYGKFVADISHLTREKIAHDVLDEHKIHTQIEILCNEINIPVKELRQKKILEVGSGFGIFVGVSRLFYGADTYGIEPADGEFNTTFDISKEIMKDNGLDGDKLIINSKGENIPFADNTFDIVFSTNVLEHTDNPEKVLEESIRILKAGGYLHFIYPNYHSYFDGHYSVFHPPILSKNMLPWIVKNIYHRNPSFARTIRTELNVLSTKKMLKQIQKKYNFEVLSLGKDIYYQRMRTLNFDAWGGLGKIKNVLEGFKKMGLNTLLAKAIVSINGWSPIILTLQKK